MLIVTATVIPNLTLTVTPTVTVTEIATLTCTYTIATLTCTCTIATLTCTYTYTYTVTNVMTAIISMMLPTTGDASLTLIDVTLIYAVGVMVMYL